MRAICMTGAAAFLLSACASMPKPGMADVNSAGQSKAQLSPRTLASGDCGLFVWTADVARRFILFTRPSGQDAVWHDGTGEKPLRLNSLPPPKTQALPPKQVFTSDDGTSVSIDMRSPQLIAQGTRYKSGLLRLRASAPGDTKVVPVVGLSACQP